jgi:hypothetical protein
MCSIAIIPPSVGLFPIFRRFCLRDLIFWINAQDCVSSRRTAGIEDPWPASAGILAKTCPSPNGIIRIFLKLRLFCSILFYTENYSEKQSIFKNQPQNNSRAQEFYFMIKPLSKKMEQIYISL